MRLVLIAIQPSHGARASMQLARRGISTSDEQYNLTEHVTWGMLASRSITNGGKDMYTLQCGAFEAVGLSWDIVSRAMRVMVPDWDGTIGTWHTGTTDICRVLRTGE